MNSSPTIRITSIADDSYLDLSDFIAHADRPESDTFSIQTSHHGLPVKVIASTFLTTDLGVYFYSLLTDPEHWTGPKKWSTLEGDFELIAHTTSQGRIRLEYFIRHQRQLPHTSHRGSLEISTGHLEVIAGRIASAWALVHGNPSEVDLGIASVLN